MYLTFYSHSRTFAIDTGPLLLFSSYFLPFSVCLPPLPKPRLYVLGFHYVARFQVLGSVHLIMTMEQITPKLSGLK